MTICSANAPEWASTVRMGEKVLSPYPVTDQQSGTPSLFASSSSEAFGSATGVGVTPLPAAVSCQVEVLTTISMRTNRTARAGGNRELMKYSGAGLPRSAARSGEQSTSSGRPEVVAPAGELLGWQ